MLTRKQVEMHYRLSPEGIVRDLGQFEGEPWWIVALWIDDGCSGDASFDVNGRAYEIWNLTSDETEALREYYQEDVKPFAVLYQDNYGFVSGYLTDQADVNELARLEQDQTDESGE